MPTGNIEKSPSKASIEAKRRPASAPMDGQFWIIVNLEIDSETPKKFFRPKEFFRHASASLAFAEAERLRDTSAGGAFGVFFCCGICRKEEQPAIPEKAEATA
jgi:hypothetical protein